MTVFGDAVLFDCLRKKRRRYVFGDSRNASPQAEVALSLRERIAELNQTSD